MTGQTQFQFSTRQIPNFDNTVTSTCGKPLVTRFDSNRADPSQVTRYDALESPLGMEFGLDGTGGFMAGESF